MKRTSLLVTAIAATIGAASSGSALAADVGVAVNVGDPGFYGRIDIGDAPQPRVISPRPVIIAHEHVSEDPVYIYVPADQQRDWSRYCSHYDACGRPVYFVEDNWYKQVYVPHYREHHAHVSDRHELREEAREAKQDAREAKHDAREAAHDAKEAKRDARAQVRDEDR